jgi:hypothetical protein
MKRIMMFLALITMSSVTLYAMPSQITFQGTLKQQGVPVNTPQNLTFSFVDGTGATIPGTSPIPMANVQVINGLFAVQLPIDPTIPWEQYTPYVRVSVGGQILTPDQPLNANLYAVAAIPQGMIAMFAASCPTGWTRFSALDNLFPMGGASYGTTGGAATHTHTLTEGTPVGTDGGNTVGTSTHGGGMAAYVGGSTGSFFPTTDTTTSASNLPPYLTVVYCEKN